jgi:hypothetical protein
MKHYKNPTVGEELEFNIDRLMYDIKNLSPYYTDVAGRTQTNNTPYDNVDHPAHYNTGKYESIDVMVETQGVDAVKNFCICNAFKYIYRHRFKNGVEDIKKAIWYLNKYVELEEREQPNE